MNTTTPRLRQHLLAELRDLPDHTATTEQLAGQVPCFWRTGRGMPGSAVYPHLVSLEKKGQLRRIKPADSRVVLWQLVTA